MNTPSSALEYLASAYEEMGYKVVALALRKHGANAAKFKVELRAIEAAIRGTREEDAAIADRLDKNGEVGMVIRNAADLNKARV
jgi:alpha-beta hydrolase superfamily lysophospholipase